MRIKAKNCVAPEVAKARGERLKQARELGRLTRKHLSEGIPHTPDTIYRWEDGRFQGINKHSVPALVKCFRQYGVIVTEHWLLEGQGSPPFMATPLNSDIDANERMEREIEFFNSLNPDTIGCRVLDSTMAPQYMLGDYLAGLLLTEDQRIYATGKVCLVQISGTDQLILRHVEHTQTANSFSLLCKQPTENQPMVMAAVTLDIIAPIIWHRRPATKIFTQSNAYS